MGFLRFYPADVFAFEGFCEERSSARRRKNSPKQYFFRIHNFVRMAERIRSARRRSNIIFRAPQHFHSRPAVAGGNRQFCRRCGSSKNAAVCKIIPERLRWVIFQEKLTIFGAFYANHSKGRQKRQGLPAGINKGFPLGKPLSENDRPTGIRTPNQLLKRQLLYR